MSELELFLGKEQSREVALAFVRVLLRLVSGLALASVAFAIVVS